MKKQAAACLNSARRQYGACAKSVSSRKVHAGNLSPVDTELIVGLGTAQDWIRWATSLVDMQYGNRAERKSERKNSVTETVRFNMLWTATNSLFAKESILDIISPGATHPTPELHRFKKLYEYADIDPNIESKCVDTVNGLLGMLCLSAGVISATGNKYPTMWEVIDAKYSRPKDRTLGIGKLIHTAISAKTLPTPGGPEIIYGVRNWSVHGMLLTSFFRGSQQKYITFIDSITYLLALVLKGAADKFVKAV